MYYLLLEKFNNYINRLYKSFDTVADYIAYQEDEGNSYHYETTKKINFDDNNKIRASHIFNDNLKPDYLIWIDETTGNIVSRWFVISYKHTSGTQFRAELKRDSIADNYSNIIESPVFIEKGYVGNDDPAVFNHEDMTVNQIKKAEYPIKQTPSAWIVGYLASDNSMSGEKTFSYKSISDYKIAGNFSDWDLYDLCDGTEKRSVISDSAGNILKFTLRQLTLTDRLKRFALNKNSHYTEALTGSSDYYTIAGNTDILNPLSQTEWYNSFSWSTILGYINTIEGYVDETSANTIIDYNDKVLEFDDGLYRINVAVTYARTPITHANNDTSLATYITGIIDTLLGAYSSRISTTLNKPIYYQLELKRFFVIATKLDDAPGTYKYTFSSTNKALLDAPYKMFAIPYNVSAPGIPFYVGTTSQTDKIVPNKDVALAWAMSIIREASTNLYDIQILPYIPEDNLEITKNYTLGVLQSFGVNLLSGTENVDFIKLIGTKRNRCYGTNTQDIYDNENTFSYIFTYQNDNIKGADSYEDLDIDVSHIRPNTTITNAIIQNINYVTGTVTFLIEGTKTTTVESITTDFSFIVVKNNTPVNYCYFFEKCNFTINQMKAVKDMRLNPVNNVTNYKESNETELYRLTGPNMASSFEFSPAKNGGNLRDYKAYCSYKPFTPFICVAPIFYGLYGGIYDDNRGLILTGDFSLDIITDSWTTYKLQNKNYQLAFDRQIENLEINQEVQRMNEIVSSTAGVLKGGLAGGMAGGISGGVPGAVVGAVVGTVSSTVGGLLDYTNNQKLRKETIDYTKDQFGYSLRNIQALPRTINKVSSLVTTNKFFPFVEYYSCTPEELQAFQDKIKYNGMSINRIGFIKDFLNPSDTTYIKGKLIRNTTISCNADELLDIANELDKGVFI